MPFLYFPDLSPSRIVADFRPGAELVRDHRRVEVQRVHRAGPLKPGDHRGLSARRGSARPRPGDVQPSSAEPELDLVREAASSTSTHARLAADGEPARDRPARRTPRGRRARAPSARRCRAGCRRRRRPRSGPSTASTTSGSASSAAGDAVELAAAVVRDDDRRRRRARPRAARPRASGSPSARSAARSRRRSTRGRAT